jgi:hypothetical protein
MKSRFPASLTHLLPLMALLFSGCAGYQLGTTKPAALTGIQNIHVPTFENQTLEPRYSVLVTNAVISALQQDGTYQVTDLAKADAVLKGKITQNLRRQQRSVDTNILRTRELLSLTRIQYQLETPDGKTIRQSDPFGIDVEQVNAVTGQRESSGVAIGRSTIFLDENFQLSERQALALAAEDAALTIVNELTNAW